MTLTFELDVDNMKMNQRRSKVKDLLSAHTGRHTLGNDCSTWTFKVVSKNLSLSSKGLKAEFHYAIQVAGIQVAGIQVADLRVRVVCVSQAGRKLVESQLRTGLRPGSRYLDILR